MKRKVCVTVRKLGCFGTMCLAMTLSLSPALAVWTGEKNNNLYLDEDNWEDGIIDNSFAGAPVAGGTTFLFDGDHLVTNAMVLPNVSFTMWGVDGNRMLTLGGDVILPGTDASGVMGWYNSDGMRLGVDLGGATRTFQIDGRELLLHDGLHGTGGFVKEGPGMLALYYTGQSTFEGDIVVNEGELQVWGEATLGEDAGNVTMNNGTILFLAFSYYQPHSLARRFSLTNATLRPRPGEHADFRSILCADTPIVKDGSHLYLGYNVNEYSGGIVVKENALILSTSGAGGQDVPGNDFTADGGFVMIGAADAIGESQKIIVEAEDPAVMSGFGISANVDYPTNIVVHGDHPGIVVLNTGSDKPETDVTARHYLEQGWYLGGFGNYGGTFTGSSLPTDPDGDYRLTGHLTLPNSVLTGAHGLRVGSPKSANPNAAIYVDAPQPYTGATSVHGTMAMYLRDEGALTGTPEIRLASSMNCGYSHMAGVAQLHITGRKEGYTQRTPIDAPIIMDSAPTVYFWGAELRITIDSWQANGMVVTNGIGPIVFATGRSMLFHSFMYNRADEFYMRTESPSLGRLDRSMAMVMLPTQQADVPEHCYPRLGAWRTETSVGKLPPGGNRLIFTDPPHTVGGLVPFMFGNDFNHYDSHAYASSLVAYDETQGLHVLRRVADADGNGPDYYAGDIAFASPTDNVCTVNATVEDDLTVNSLTASALTIAPDTTLTVKSGVIFASGISAADRLTSVLDFDGAECVVYDGSGISASIAGTNGITIRTDGELWISGNNSYSGQTTIVGGTAAFGSSWAPYGWAVDTEIYANATLPDDGLVLIHPGAVFKVGIHNAYCTREVIGALGGGGIVRPATLGYAGESEWMNSGLVIGAPVTPGDWDVWSNAFGRVVLNGGTLRPGMTHKRGTLTFTTSTYESIPVPVELKNGTFAIAIDKELACDAIAVDGTLTIGDGDALFLDVTVEEGAKITEGMAWTIATAGTLDVQDERLFKKVLSNHPKWDFAADTIGDTLVITACHRQTATAILVR